MAEKDNCDLNTNNGAASASGILNMECDEETEDTPKPEELGSTLEEITRNLEILRLKCTEKKIETVVPKRIIENKEVADFLNEILRKNNRNIKCTKVQRDELVELLAENDKLSLKALQASKENQQLEVVIMEKKLELKETREERNKAWKEAEKVLKQSSWKFLESDEESSSEISRDSFDEEKEIKSTVRDIMGKLQRVKQLARILYNLVTCSKEPWATDEDLLEVVCCTGKLLERDFNKGQLAELKELVDDVVHRLDHVHI